MISRETLYCGTIDEIEEAILKDYRIHNSPGFGSLRTQLEQVAFIDALDDKIAFGMVFIMVETTIEGESVQEDPGFIPEIDVRLITINVKIRPKMPKNDKYL